MEAWKVVFRSRDRRPSRHDKLILPRFPIFRASRETLLVPVAGARPISLFGLFLFLLLFGQLGAEEIAESAEALARGWGLAAVGLVLGTPFGALGGGAGQAVPAALVDVDDLGLELRAHRRRLLIVGAARRAQLGVRDQSLAFRPGDEHAVGLHAVHLRVDHVPHP